MIRLTTQYGKTYFRCYGNGYPSVLFLFPMSPPAVLLGENSFSRRENRTSEGLVKFQLVRRPVDVPFLEN